MTEESAKWVPLKQGLSQEDRAHVGKILRSSVTSTRQGERLSEVGVFLRDRTFLEESSVEAFKRLDPVDREKLLSELIWRVTCLLDGSMTEVLGHRWYPIGPRFRACRSEWAGKDVLCLALETEFDP